VKYNITGLYYRSMILVRYLWYLQ